MLVVEGTDLTGKTTLCQALLERLNAGKVGGPWSYAHLGALPREWNYVTDYVQRTNPRVVQDRWFHSELAYGPAVRGGSKVGPREWRLIDAWFKLMGGFTIVVTASDSALRKRYEECARSQLFAADQIVAVNQRFKWLCESGGPAFADVVVDCGDGFPTDDKHMDKVMDAVGDYITRMTMAERYGKENKWWPTA